MPDTDNPGSDELLFELTDGIGLLTFNRPEAFNAITMAMYTQLEQICNSLSDRKDVKALILTGAGKKAFAAGTDISQFRDFSGAQDALDYENRIDSVLSALERCPVPTIAAIPGACIGGGAGIAAACDLRLATNELKFGFPIARTLGNCLSSATLTRLSALVGAGRLRELIFTARLMKADEALQIGLVMEVHESHDALMNRAQELATSVAGHAPLTLRATKEGLRRLATSDYRDDDLITLCYTSADFKEGMTAFLQKRKPDWQGR